MTLIHTIEKKHKFHSMEFGQLISKDFKDANAG
jgi:hypothetical protein